MTDSNTRKVTPIRPGLKVPKSRQTKKKWKSGANWEVLEHYYRIGWTLSDIARLPEAKGVTTQAISNRIRRYNWSRNLEPRVADAARAIMATGLDDAGKPSREALALLRGDKKKEDEIVLTSAAQIAERLTTTRRRSKRLDTIITRISDLLESELEHLEEEAAGDDREKVRIELNRLTKSVGQLVTAVSKANEEERNVNDLRRLMKPKEEVKPLLVKKRAIIDEEGIREEDDVSTG